MHTGAELHDDEQDDTPPGWEPDEVLLEAALHNRIIGPELCHEDRCYLIGALGGLGYTVRDIADRLHCSARFVFRLRREPATMAWRAAFEAQEEARAAGAYRRRGGPHECPACRDHKREAQVLRGRLDAAVDGLARTRRDLEDTRREAARLRAGAPVTVLAYRRRPTPRQVRQSGDGLF